MLYELDDIIHSKKLNAGGKELVSRAVLNPPITLGRKAGVRIEVGSDSKIEIDSPTLPIIIDSPLASRFTQVYRELKPFWDNEALQSVERGHNPRDSSNC